MRTEQPLGVVEDMITEVDNADGRAMAFRFPVGTKKGGGRQELLGDKYEYFDMRKFRDQATRLAHFIDGCSDQLLVYLEHKDEIDCEYQDFMRDDW